MGIKQCCWQLNKIIVAIILSICLISAVMAEATVDVKPVSVDTFDSIMLDGNMTLVLTNADKGSTTHTVKISRPKGQSYDITVKDNVLHINQTTPWWEGVGAGTLTVDVGELKHLVVRDSASVSSEDFHCERLTIDADTAGTIKLAGKIGVENITTKGPGLIDIAWVTSSNLIVDSYGSGTTKLSGTVDEIQARLSNHSVLDAQYLRAKVVSIQTKDYAKALVAPIDSLSAYTHDYSNVFYYQEPKHFSHFNTESGNVLQMSW